MRRGARQGRSEWGPPWATVVHPVAVMHPPHGMPRFVHQAHRRGAGRASTRAVQPRPIGLLDRSIGRRARQVVQSSPMGWLASVIVVGLIAPADQSRAAAGGCLGRRRCHLPTRQGSGVSGSPCRARHARDAAWSDKVAVPLARTESLSLDTRVTVRLTDIWRSAMLRRPCHQAVTGDLRRRRLRPTGWIRDLSRRR